MLMDSTQMTRLPVRRVICALLLVSAAMTGCGNGLPRASRPATEATASATNEAAQYANVEYPEWPRRATIPTDSQMDLYALRSLQRQVGTRIAQAKVLFAGPVDRSVDAVFTLVRFVGNGPDELVMLARAHGFARLARGGWIIASRQAAPDPSATRELSLLLTWTTKPQGQVASVLVAVAAPVANGFEYQTRAGRSVRRGVYDGLAIVRSPRLGISHVRFFLDASPIAAGDVTANLELGTAQKLTSQTPISSRTAAVSPSAKPTGTASPGSITQPSVQPTGSASPGNASQPSARPTGTASPDSGTPPSARPQSMDTKPGEPKTRAEVTGEPVLGTMKA